MPISERQMGSFINNQGTAYTALLVCNRAFDGILLFLNESLDIYT